MADVFLASADGPSSIDGRKLAVVKKLRAHLADDDEFLTMLTDEARITARLAHPNVVRLYEFDSSEDQLFLAMEFLDGQSFGRVQRRAERERKDMPVDLQLMIVSDVLAGLHHAHELVDFDGRPLNVVHRDVNPANVFVTYDGQVKVLDFGIAKARGRMSQTAVGTLKGKLRYMAPEQVAGKPIDRRADVFAAGVMLWQALARRRFWGDLDDHEILHALARATFDASPRAVCPDVSVELDAICKKALARNPADRYQTAEEMRADLEVHIDARRGLLRARLGQWVADMFEPERRMTRRILDETQHVEFSGDDEHSALNDFQSLVSKSIQASLSQSYFRLPKADSGEVPLAIVPPAASSLAPMSLDTPPDLADLLEPARRAAAGPRANATTKKKGARAWVLAAATAMAIVAGVASSAPALELASGDVGSTATARRPSVVAADLVAGDRAIRGKAARLP
jgi:serine/threonine-protein kinase